MYLLIGKVIGHIEENNWNQCLVFYSLDKNKEVLKTYKELWNGIKNKIEIINDGEFKYGKDFTIIKFDTDDDLPFKKTIKSAHVDNNCQICFWR